MTLGLGKIFRILALFTVWSGVAYGQNTTVTGTIVDPNTNAYANGTVSAQTVPTNGQAIRSTTPSALSGSGFFSIVIPSSTYIFTFCASPVNIGPLGNVTPQQVCFQSGVLVISGGSMDISATVNPLAKVIGPKPGSGSASGCVPAGPVNGVLVNNGGGCSNGAATDNGTLFSINEDTGVKGPNPWADIRNFGKAATLSATTATVSNGSPTVTLAAASNFQNGEYATVFNAGAACGLATPATPTVTPSVNSGGVNTVAANAGASSFAYQVVAASKLGCYTAASASGSTATGNSLGMQTLTISTQSRSNNVVTTVTTGNHNLVVNQLIHVAYFSTGGDGTFEGFWTVSGIVNPTTFTYLQGWDTRFGASTSSTGGTIKAFNANRVSWTATPGAWKYYVFGRTGGAFNLLGVTYTNKWVDYGSPMNDNQTFPTFIPTTAPVSGGNNHLTAQILSGGGTTTLTLASNASMSLGGLTIRSDDGPAMVAAAIASPVSYIPASGATINSYTVLPAVKLVKVGGSITTNDTIEIGSASKLEGWSSTSAQSFSSGSFPNIQGATAYPQLVFNTSARLNKVHLQCTAANGCLSGLDTVDAVGLGFDDVDLVSSAGNLTDYLGMNLIFQGGSFNYRFKNVLFTSGTPGANDTTNVGNSPIPTVLLTPRPADGQGTSNIGVYGSWFTNRGSIQLDAGTNGFIWGVFKDIQTQSMSLPFLQFTGFSGLPGGMDFQNLTGADRATAYIGIYTPVSFGVGMTALNVTCGTGGRGSFTGNPYTNLFASNLCGLGQNTGYSYAGGGFYTDTNMLGNVIGFPMAAPVGVPTAVISAGGGVPVDTWTFKVLYADLNGNLSAPTNQSLAAVVTGGNQTVTITRPAGTPTGAVSWAPYASNGGGYARIACGLSAMTTTTFIWNVGFTCGISIGSANGTASSIGANGIIAPSYQVWSNGFGAATSIPANLTAGRTETIPDGNTSRIMVSTLTTTAAATDNVTVQGVTASSHCSLTPTNSNAATDSTATFVSSVSANTVVVAHPANAGRTWNIFCSPN